MKIGIDLGGTTMTAGLVDDANCIRLKTGTDTLSLQGADSVIQRMAGLEENLSLISESVVLECWTVLKGALFTPTIWIGGIWISATECGLYSVSLFIWRMMQTARQSENILQAREVNIL